MSETTTIDREELHEVLKAMLAAKTPRTVLELAQVAFKTSANAARHKVHLAIAALETDLLIIETRRHGTPEYVEPDIRRSEYEIDPVSRPTAEAMLKKF